MSDAVKPEPDEFLEEYRNHPDARAVDRFAKAMKLKLWMKRNEGKGGWDNSDVCTVEHLADLLIEHIEKGDPIDIGNFAMMLHQRQANHDVLPSRLKAKQPVADEIAQVPDSRVITATGAAGLLQAPNISDPELEHAISELNGAQTYTMRNKEIAVIRAALIERNNIKVECETLKSDLKKANILAHDIGWERDELLAGNKDEIGWLVEWRDSSETSWWGRTPDGEDDFGWTKDSLKALRFARCEDAQAYIEEEGWTDTFPTEHMWPAIKKAGEPK